MFLECQTSVKLNAKKFCRWLRWDWLPYSRISRSRSAQRRRQKCTAAVLAVEKRRPFSAPHLSRRDTAICSLTRLLQRLSTLTSCNQPHNTHHRNRAAAAPENRHPPRSPACVSTASVVPDLPIRSSPPPPGNNPRADHG